MSPDDDYPQFYSELQDELHPDPQAKRDVLTNCGRVKCATCIGFGTVLGQRMGPIQSWVSCPDCLDGYVYPKKGEEK